MKRIIFANIALFSTVLFGWTEFELTQIERAERFVSGYSTNKVFHGNSYEILKKNPMLAAQIDDILYLTPPVNFVYEKIKILPKTFSNACIAARQEYPMFVTEDGFDLSSNQDRAFCISRGLAWIDLCGGNLLWNERIRKWSFEAASKSVRRHLRSSGRRITIGPDGSDPCMPYIQAVSDALDAPMYTGLSNALAQCGVTIVQPLKFRSVFDDAKLSIVTNEIFMGDVPFDKKRQWHVMFRLGRIEYNKFIDRYNGGSR